MKFWLILNFLFCLSDLGSKNIALHRILILKERLNQQQSKNVDNIYKSYTYIFVGIMKTARKKNGQTKQIYKITIAINEYIFCLF